MQLEDGNNINKQYKKWIKTVAGIIKRATMAL